MIKVTVPIWPRCAQCGAPLQPQGGTEGGVISLHPCVRCEDKMKKEAYLKGKKDGREKDKTTKEETQQDEERNWKEGEDEDDDDETCYPIR